MTAPRLDHACIDFAEAVLEDELRRTKTAPATSARVLSLAAAIQDAVEAWAADHDADRPAPAAL